MLNKLSNDQLARLPEFVNKWSAVGLSTKSVDHKWAENHISNAYRAAGNREPEMYVWLKSPLLGAIAYLGLLRLGDVEEGKAFGPSLDLTPTFLRPANLNKVKASIAPELFSILTRDMADCVRTRVHDLVDAVIRDAVVDGLAGALRSDAWFSLGESLMNRVGGEIWTNIRKEILSDLPALSTMVFRQGIGKEVPLDLRCLYDYLSEVCGLRELIPDGSVIETQPLVWWWPFEKVCILTERYTELHRDEHLMLHNQYGPSVKYSDDWSVYCFHGIPIEPSAIRDPNSITPQTILQERKPIIRGILIDLYGRDRFSRDTGIELRPLSQYREGVLPLDSEVRNKVAAYVGHGSPQPVYLVRDTKGI